jgi:hypothetical protein
MENMKKILLTLSMLLLSVALVFASPVRFVFGDLGQHPEILMGFAPSYALAGAGFQLMDFGSGNKTELQVLGGAGYNQRKLWQAPGDGAPIYDNPLIYDVIQTDWSLRLAQGLCNSPVQGKSLCTLTLSYDGKYEMAKDSMVKGQDRVNNSTAPVPGLDEWLGGVTNAYPDLSGDHTYLGAVFGAQIKLDMMDDRKTATDGFVAKFDFRYAPLKFNNYGNGYADFRQYSINAVNAKTVCRVQDEGKDIFTIVLIDRANAGWMIGNSVPASAILPFSLGRKVRGFKAWSYDTELAFVNNFDIRFAGPNLGVNGIFPRMNLFFDMGYGFGNYINSNIDSKGKLLMSTGIQATVSFFDFIDLGYQVAYLIEGQNASLPSNKVVGSFTFFLDF